MVEEYMDKNGKVKEKKIQLRFIDTFRFMASSLDALLSINLVGVNGMICKICGKVANLLT